MLDTKSTLRQSPVVLMPRGDLTLTALQSALEPIEAELRRGPRGLLVDVRQVQNMHGEARDYFLRWTKEHKARISAMAIVTEKKRWRVLVAAASLVRGRALRAFPEPMAATAWLVGAG